MIDYKKTEYFQWIFILLFLGTFHSGWAQDRSGELSKMDQFTSKTGSIIKFQDYEIGKLPVLFSVAEVAVRRISNAGSSGYFASISKEGKKATVAFEDLIELQKAVYALKKDLPNDLESKPQYLENKFVTDDGFQLGYYCKSSKVQWFIVLEKYGSGNTVFLKDITDFESTLKASINKIQSLKSL